MSILKIASMAEDVSGGVDDFTATMFDADMTDRSIKVLNYESMILDWSHYTPTGKVWMHFRMKGTAMAGSANDGLWFELIDINNKVIARIDTANGNQELEIYGGTVIETGFLWSPVSDTFYDIDMSVEITGGNITINFYVDGLLVMGGTTTVGTSLLPVKAVFDHDDFATAMNYSEIFVRDNDESTIGIRLKKLPGDANGFHTQGEGDYTDLNSIGLDGVLLAATEKYSWSVANLGLTPAPSAISAVAVNHRIQSGGPTQFTPFVRVSATDYDDTTQTIVEGQDHISEFATNPATTAAWTAAEVDALEVGVHAVA